MQTSTDSNDPARYGREWVDEYDVMQSVGDSEIPAEVDCLARLAQGGPVLEVAAGTGRIAVPLAEKGLDVTATDASPVLLEKLKEKDAHKLVRTEVDVLPAISNSARYGLIFIVLNSIWVMRSADEQRQFLRNAADHLQPEGVLVVEMAVANPEEWFRSLEGSVQGISLTRTTRWTPVTQQLVHEFRITTPKSKSPELRQVPLRVVFPNELLLMAELAGLRVREVYASWDGSPFQDDSHNMIAVFQRAS